MSKFRNEILLKGGKMKTETKRIGLETCDSHGCNGVAAVRVQDQMGGEEVVAASLDNV